MINAEITFYNVGLSDKNLPYNRTALVNILAAGVITNGGQTYILRLTDLAFGTPFNIDEATYQIVASATYIEIYTKDENNQNDQYRYCFINNFLRLANGNWAVSYTIDDWTSFYIGGQSGTSSPYNIHIDGFTERANVPLYERASASQYTTDYNKVPLMGQFTSGIKKIEKITRRRNFSAQKPYASETGLPPGYVCAVYFMSAPKFKGDPITFLHSGKGQVYDIDAISGELRYFPRLNNYLYFMVYDQNGNSCGLFYKANQNDQYYKTVPGNDPGRFSYGDPDDTSIDKIMFFDYIPVKNTAKWNYGFQLLTYEYEINGTTYHETVYGLTCGGYQDENERKRYCADLLYLDNNEYGQALYIDQFCPIEEYNLPSNISVAAFGGIYRNNYDDYLKYSPYRFINENRKYTIKILDTELDIPIEYLDTDTKIFLCYSGDGETVIVKFYSPTLAAFLASNNFAATGQNVNYLDLAIQRDFKAYKNAKITGAAGIAATALGSITALGTSIASGNVAGVVGALSGGAQGIMSGVQKLQGLTPYKQSPASGDLTLTKMLSDETNSQDEHQNEFFDLFAHTSMWFIYENLPNKLNDQKIRDNEENGVAVLMSFDDYISGCQMEAFNALKMANVDVSGAPQQIARRIEEALLSGITLWTATDVGNKKVINYPLETGA